MFVPVAIGGFPLMLFEVCPPWANTVEVRQRAPLMAGQSDSNARPDQSKGRYAFQPLQGSPERYAFK